MTEHSKLLCQLVSEKRIAEIDYWIAKYPADQRQSAVMSTLRIVQEEHGFLSTELKEAVADYLGMPEIAVNEVATFYTMYENKPIGRHLISVCTSISCQLRGSKEVVNHLETQLGIKVGQTTTDGRYTLKTAECLGACVNAPMMQINKSYHENLTHETINQILEDYA